LDKKTKPSLYKHGKGELFIKSTWCLNFEVLFFEKKESDGMTNVHF